MGNHNTFSPQTATRNQKLISDKFFEGIATY